MDRCGEQAPDGCWCDPQCFAFGDCCADICEECGTCEDDFAGFEAAGQCEEWMTGKGCCSEDGAAFCYDNVLYVGACEGQVCGWDADKGRYGCVDEESVDPDGTLSSCEEQAEAFVDPGEEIDAGVTEDAGVEEDTQEPEEDAGVAVEDTNVEPSPDVEEEEEEAVGPPPEDGGCRQGSEGLPTALLAFFALMVLVSRRTLASRS